MPFFSVVIPTYNRADLLPRCLDSVLEQSFADFEIIVVDNFSEDNTLQILECYKKKDSRVQFVQEHNNGIIAHSRNVGCKMALGTYVCFLDSDDWFSNNKLSIVYDALQNNNADLIYHRMQSYSKEKTGSIIGKQLTWNNKFEELLVKGNTIINSSVCVKRDALLSIGGISEDIKLRTAEDADCWLRLAKSGYKMEFINKVLGYYWTGDNCSSNINTLQQREYLYSIYIGDIGGFNKKKAQRTLNYIRGIRYYEAGIKQKAIYYYYKSIPMYSSIKTLKAIYMIFKSILQK